MHVHRRHCPALRGLVPGPAARHGDLMDGDEAVRLLGEALHLRMNGERAPGGNETWAEWNRKAETFLRARLNRLHPETRDERMPQ